MPLSQIHYHFGSRDALLLALLDYQNQQLIERQRSTFAADTPLWQRWDKACDYLDEDIASGYVRILQEMMAAGWSNPEVAAAIRRIIGEWQALLNVVAEEATKRLGPISGLETSDIASLVATAFLGSEAMHSARLRRGRRADPPSTATCRRVDPDRRGNPTTTGDWRCAQNSR